MPDLIWKPKTWSGLTEFDGRYTWNDGTNTYYSTTSIQYRLNGSTWEPVTWSGLLNNTYIYGDWVWKDNEGNIYHSQENYPQYKFLGNDTWERVTWYKTVGGTTSEFMFNGSYVWTDGTDMYYSQGYVQFKLNGDTWEQTSWTGLSSFSTQNLWKDGEGNIYYSYGTDHYKLNGTTWESMTWTGLTNFYKEYIWHDKLGNTYYSDDTVNNYKLNGTNWEPITWEELSSFQGRYVWFDINGDTYFSAGVNQYELKYPNPAYTGEKVLRVEDGKYISGGGGGGSTGPISASMVSYGVGTVKDALDTLNTSFGNLGTASQKDFTTSVTSGSADLVTSGGVKNAIDALGTASNKDFTTSVTSGSADLVTSGAVYTYIDSAITQVLNTGF